MCHDLHVVPASDEHRRSLVDHAEHVRRRTRADRAATVARRSTRRVRGVDGRLGGDRRRRRRRWPRAHLTTLPLPAAGSRLRWRLLRLAPGRIGASSTPAVDGDLWLQPVPAGAVRRLTRHGPDAHASSAGGRARRQASSSYVVDQAEVWRCWLDRRRVRRATRRRFGRLLLRSRHRDVDGTTWCGRRGTFPTCRGTRRASSAITFDGERASTSSRGARCDAADPRSCRTASGICVRDDTGWLNVWLGDRPLVDEPFEHAGPTWGMGQRSFAVSPDGDADRVHAQRARLRPAVRRRRRAPATSTEVARGVHGQLSWHGDRLAALRSGARTPTQVCRTTTPTVGAARARRRPGDGWDVVDLPEPELVEVEHDGVTLHARLYLAGDAAALLCWLHGGPTDQWQVDVHAAHRVLVVAGVERARARPPRARPVTAARTSRRCAAGGAGSTSTTRRRSWPRSHAVGGARRRAPSMIGRFVGRVHRARRARPASRPGRGRRRARIR